MATPCEKSQAHKICEICGIEFDPRNSAQRYCPECGKNPARARCRFEKAERINRHNAGDWYKPPAKAICKECGKEFFAIRSKSYCSDICRHSHRVRETHCPICGASLWDIGIESERDICCSPDCQKKYDIQKAKENGRYLACEQCGKMFIARKDGQKFCCRQCYLAYPKKKAEDPDEDESAGLHKCRMCGKVYRLRETWYSDVFCSPECRELAKTGKRVIPQNHTKKQTGAVTKPPKKLNVCLTCKTSQAQCERFTSRFVYIPKGAVMEKVNGKNIVVSCPKHTE